MKNVFLDTNLFILLNVGIVNPQLISKCNRLDAFSENDFKIITCIINKFDKLIILSSLLVEVTDLLDKFNNQYSSVFDNTEILINSGLIINNQIEEVVIQSKIWEFGYADCEAYKLSEMGIIVITEDMELFHYINNKNGNAQNFNYYRQEMWSKNTGM